MMDPNADFEVNSFFNRGTTKATTETKNTPVILVCISNKNSTQISHEYLHEIFSEYGQILRILIFEKVKIWKAFVEFSSIEEALNAKRNLDNTQLFNDGSRMNIYPSNLPTVRFQNNNSGGVDYTLNQENDQGQASTPQNGPSQQTTSSHFQQKFSPRVADYEPSRDRQAPLNFQSQPNSNSRDWNEPQHEISDEDFLKLLNEKHAQESYQTDSKQDIDLNYEKEDYRDLIETTFPFQRNQAPMYDKPKHQNLQIHSQPFTSQSQISMPNYMQNHKHDPNSLWSEGPPGLSFSPNQNPNSNQSMQPQNEQPKLPRMPNSFSHISLQKNNSPHNTPPLSKNGTYNDLPNPNPINPNSLNLNMSMSNFPQRHHTLGELPQIKPPQLLQFSSMSNLPNPSSFSNMGGDMNQNRMNQANQMGQLKKPMLNPKFDSQPQLPLSSEIKKMKINSMSSQHIRDLIERDILLRLMNQTQGYDGSELLEKNPVQLDLNDIKKYNIAFPENIDYNNLSQMNKETLDEIYRNLSTILNKGVENKECAVLYVKGLEDPKIKVKTLYNIFSNFGDILKIIFIRRQAAALIEYENVEYATKAKDFLNNIVFAGKQLRIYYSFHANINLRNKKTGKDFSEEIFIGTPKTFRFKKAKGLSMNPPSATLHISNIVKEKCTEDVIKETFGPFGRIESIKFIIKDNNINMCLIRMASMEESLNAMSALHDTDLGGRAIQISFTKSKI